MEDLEEYYENEEERNKELFIEKLKEKESIERVEKEYKKKSEKLRSVYEKEYKENLNKDKKKEIQKIKKRIKSKKESPSNPYKAEGLDLEFTWIERINLGISSRAYKIGRKINNIYEKITPNSIIYFNYKIKKNIKNTFREIIEFISDTFHTIINGWVQFWVSFVKGITLFFSKIEEKIKNIKNKLFKSKKEEKKNQNGNKENPPKSNEENSSK